jgi:hypothetical protein
MVTHITYTPIAYESHTSCVHFITDAGTASILCSGIVGVPYLKLPKELLAADFGVKTIERTHSKKYEMYNTGVSNIEFEFVWTNMARNDEAYSVDEFDVFTIEPNSGVILPGVALTLNMSIMPKEYGVIYKGTYVVRTTDGERYTGTAKAVGGMAIIKIKPPTSLAKQNQASKVSDPGVPGTPPKQKIVDRLAQAASEQQDTSRYIIQSHMENMYDLLAGLSIAEKKAAASEANIAKETYARSGNIRHSSKMLGRNASQKDSKNGVPKDQFTPVDQVGTASGTPDEVSFDGSGAMIINIDLRPRSSSLHDTSPRRDTPESPLSEFQSTKFIGDLLKLEKELEIAIGLRDATGALVSRNSEGNVTDEAKPLSGGKYQPGKISSRKVESDPGKLKTINVRNNSQLTLSLHPINHRREFTLLKVERMQCRKLTKIGRRQVYL